METTPSKLMDISCVCRLARENVFVPQTLTTRWTYEAYAGIHRKNFLINDGCISAVLNELQKWIRETYRINVISYPSAVFEGKYIYLIMCDLELYVESDQKYNSYEAALNDGLIDTFMNLHLYRKK